MLITNLRVRKLIVPPGSEYTTVSDEWILPSDVLEVVGYAVLTNLNLPTFDRNAGRLHVSFANERLNLPVRPDIGIVRRGHCFQCFNRKNNGSPIRLFYENYVTAAVSPNPYEVTLILQTKSCTSV